MNVILLEDDREIVTEVQAYEIETLVVSITLNVLYVFLGWLFTILILRFQTCLNLCLLSQLKIVFHTAKI